MGQKNLVLGAIGIFSGLVAYRAYTVSGLVPALAALFIVAWILYNLKARDELVDGLATLLNPFRSSINFFLIGFTYAALEGRGLMSALGIGAMGFLVGAFVSMYIYKYWNIGS